MNIPFPVIAFMASMLFTMLLVLSQGFLKLKPVAAWLTGIGATAVVGMAHNDAAVAAVMGAMWGAFVVKVYQWLWYRYGNGPGCRRGYGPGGEGGG